MVVMMIVETIHSSAFADELQPDIAAAAPPVAARRDEVAAIVLSQVRTFAFSMVLHLTHVKKQST